MNNAKSENLRNQLTFGQNKEEDCNLSDQLTSEGSVTPNVVRCAVSDVNSTKFRVKRTTFKTLEEQNMYNFVERAQIKKK